jgi:hypothetical protein
VVAKPKFTPKPRYWNDTQVALRLGVSLNYFSGKKKSYYAEGMPQPDLLLGGTDSVALEHWCNVRSGLVDRFSRDSRQSDPSLERVPESRNGARHA